MHLGIELDTSFPIISATVIHGDKVGRTLGFPTANLDVQLDPAVIKPGVYTALIELRPDEAPYTALAYFGPRYILGEHKNSFEVYVLNFDNNLYGQEVRVQLLEFRRAPLPFTDLEALRQQLEKDKLDGEQYFATHDFPRQIA